MIDEVKRYQDLKKKAEGLRTQISEAKGRQQEILRRLSDDFGCGTIEQARELLTEKRRLLNEKRAELTELCNKWEEKWGDQLKSA